MHAYDSIGSGSNSSSQVEQFVTEPSMTYFNLTCREGFYVEGNTCAPDCEEWEQYSHEATVSISALLLVFFWLAIVSGACVIIGSFIQRRTM